MSHVINQPEPLTLSQGCTVLGGQHTVHKLRVADSRQRKPHTTNRCMRTPRPCRNACAPKLLSHECTVPINCTFTAILSVMPSLAVL